VPGAACQLDSAAFDSYTCREAGVHSLRGQLQRGPRPTQPLPVYRHASAPQHQRDGLVKLVTLLVALCGVFLVACGGGSASMSTPAPSVSKGEGITPSPSVSPTPMHLDVRTIELPSDDQGVWIPMDLLKGTSSFVTEYAPNSNGPEAHQVQLRLAIFDPATGALNEFRVVADGDTGGGFSNDGRYLVWEERSRTDISGVGWKLYAMDTTNNHIWQVAEDPGVRLTGFGTTMYDPPLVVDNGRLVYFMLSTDDQGDPMWEIHLYDLNDRTDSIISEQGDANHQVFLDPSLSGDDLVWVRTLVTENEGGEPQFSNPQRSLVLMNLSSGEMKVLVQDHVTRWPVIQGDSVLYASDLPPSMHLLDLKKGADQTLTSTTSWPQARGVAGRFAVWQNMSGTQAIVCDTTTGAITVLSDPQQAVYYVYVADQRVYWPWSARTGPGTSDMTHVFLSSVDLPP